VTADKIYLVGFMAAGKTTVARALAERLGWRAEDIDELIEARERRTVAEIFARNGEPYFRALERDILKLLLPLRVPLRLLQPALLLRLPKPPLQNLPRKNNDILS